MPEEVSSAVFGNVGTIVSFRVSPEDAPFLEKYFTPQFDSGDIIQLANRDFVTTMTVAGEKIPAFSGRSLELPEENHNNLDQIIENSRTMYGIDKAIVEKEINKYHQISTDIPLNENSRSSNKNRNNKSKKQKNKILEQKKQD